MMGQSNAHQNAVFMVPENQRPIIPVKVCGPCKCKNVRMMVDSGNDVSLINRHEAAELCMTPDMADRNVRVAGISQNPMSFYLYGHVPIQLDMSDPVEIPIAVGDIKENLLGRENIRHAFDVTMTRNTVELRRHSDVPIANLDRYHHSQPYNLRDTHSHTHGMYRGGQI